MICNIEKTELIVFNGPSDLSVEIEGKEIKASQSIRALGLTIDNKLRWDLHVNNQTSRITKVLNGIKIVKRKFETDQLKKIVTAQVFSILYYCDVVWLNPSLGLENFKKLKRIHYAALRIIQGDWRRNMSKTALNKLTQRLPPEAWCKYSAYSLILKISRSKMPSNLWVRLNSNLYHNARYQNPFLIDLSLKKVGKKIIFNWIGTEMKKLSIL